ncbi:MAG TPA: NAD(P)-dependent alcohol dehydrogenase [Euzebyales bacterium]|nr:NAD(P)-dependent alcohol dehydrogenase [Euzebyales bacterium]
MKAVVQQQYGSPDALEVREIAMPTIADDEVLVRVRAASVHPDVWHVVQGVPYVLRLMGAGLRHPTNPVPGTDVAGKVDAVGAKVTRLRPGDEVFGETVRGHQWRNGGAYAEYVAVPADQLEMKPANVTFEQAAAVPTSGIIALQNVRDVGRVRPGDVVLVNGAGGGVGLLAVQLAKAYGAEVTGVDRADRLDLVQLAGADHVIDYTTDDFTRGDERYDLIVDIPGNHPFAECRRVLTPGGRYVLIGHDRFGDEGARWIGRGLRAMLPLMARSPFVPELPPPNMKMSTKHEALAALRALLEAGAISPVVGRTFPLHEVPEAIRCLARGDTPGKIVITV